MVNCSLEIGVMSMGKILMRKYGRSALSLEEVASELCVEPNDIEHAVLSGELESRCIGNKTRITIESIIQFMSGNSDTKYPTGNKHKIIDLLDLVLKNKKTSCKKLASYRWYCNLAKHIKMFFGDASIEDLDNIDVSRFVAHITHKENGDAYSQQLIRTNLNLLNNVCSYARKKGYVSANIIDDRKGSIPGKKSVSREKIISRKSLRRLMFILESSPTYKPLAYVLLHTGMRIGEALALRWTDVDEDLGVIHIEQSLSLYYDEDEDGNLINKHYAIGDTKTVCSVRDVPVDATVFTVLHEWKKYSDAIIYCHEKYRRKGNRNIVFVNKFGDLRSYGALEKDFKRYLQLKGYMDHITFHMFRHTYATLLQDSGVDINVIRQLLGHTDIQTTANIYIKVNIQPMRDAVNLLSGTFTQIGLL